MNLEPRIKYPELAPKPFKALFDLSAAAQSGVLGRKLVELVFLRVSQINGCAFCVDMHWRDLIKQNEDPRRLNAVAAWREARFFDARERAALRWAALVTAIPHQDLDDEDFAEIAGPDERRSSEGPVRAAARSSGGAADGVLVGARWRRPSTVRRAPGRGRRARGRQRRQGPGAARGAARTGARRRLRRAVSPALLVGLPPRACAAQRRHGFVVRCGAEITAAVSFAFDQASRATRVFIVRNPEKLARLPLPSSARAPGES
jgi:AhpD family alkylhydroperoxidase